MKRYQIIFNQDNTRNWQEREEANRKRFIAIVNRIVELGGTVETDKYFDYRYVYNHFNANLTKEQAEEIGKLPLVQRISEA